MGQALRVGLSVFPHVLPHCSLIELNMFLQPLLPVLGLGRIQGWGSPWPFILGNFGTSKGQVGNALLVVPFGEVLERGGLRKHLPIRGGHPRV